MKNTRSFYIITLIILGGLISSCQKFVEIGVPKNQATGAAVFADSTNASAAVNGIYVAMMQTGSFNLCAGGLTLYPGFIFRRNGAYGYGY